MGLCSAAGPPAHSEGVLLAFKPVALLILRLPEVMLQSLWQPHWGYRCPQRWFPCYHPNLDYKAKPL